MICALLEEYLADERTLVTCVQNKAVFALTDKLAAQSSLFFIVAGVCVRIHLHLHLYVHLYLRVHMYVRMYVCVCARVRLCVHVYIHTYMLTNSSHPSQERAHESSTNTRQPTAGHC